MEKETRKLSLFDNYTMGTDKLSSRIAMAALTRMRANPKTGVPNDLHVKYYSERAEDAAFVLTECTAISKNGLAFPGACGIYSKEQIEGWKKVTNAVHDKKGKIYIQIWHCGRAASINDIESSPIAPSLVQEHQGKHASTPHVLLENEISEVIDTFYQGALNAKEAGFDGVELHGANGYLVDQFLKDSSNRRKDKYGGSIENKCRFALEVIDKLIEVFGAGRTGIKVSPCGRMGLMFDNDPVNLYKHLLRELGKRKIAFVEVMQAPDFNIGKYQYYSPTGEEQIPEMFKTMKPFFYYDKDFTDYKPTFIANNNLDYEASCRLLGDGLCDMVTFGRMYISNPDLVYRLKNGYKLTNPDWNSVYSDGELGYTTYLKYDQLLKLTNSK